MLARRHPLSSFTAEASSSLPGPRWLHARRDAAFERFATSSLPSESEEIWRYSRIDDLELDAYRPVSTEASVEPGIPAEFQPVLDAIGERDGLLLFRNGMLAHAEVDPELARRGVIVGGLDDAADGEDLVGSVAGPADVFVDMNTAFVADVAVVRVPRNVVAGRPIVVLHWVDTDGAAVFPRVVIKAEEASQVSVLDHLASPAGTTALVSPVVELDVGEASNLSYLGVQGLGSSVWQVAYQASSVARDATLTSALVALGGGYARVRSDSGLTGQGSTSNLMAVYFGDGTQMHDFRTLQDHEAPKTTSDLLFKGAVEDEAHSVYSGLIRVRKGAAGTNAFQTNRNLVLTKGAHADSVPNLEIEENDVRCSHASAVGPVDEDQRYYLEARGVPPEAAERLIVLGFFDDVLHRTPIPGLRQPLRRAVEAKLEGRRS